mgnify:CR=1 FL=1
MRSDGSKGRSVTISDGSGGMVFQRLTFHNVVLLNFSSFTINLNNKVNIFFY